MAYWITSGCLGVTSANTSSYMITVLERWALSRSTVMPKKSCLITTLEGLPSYSTYFLSFGCAGCTFRTFATIKPERDGTVSFTYVSALHPQSLLRCKRVRVPIDGVRVSISCECCKLAELVFLVSKDLDGTFFIAENFLNVLLAGFYFRRSANV